MWLGSASYIHFKRFKHETLEKKMSLDSWVRPVTFGYSFTAFWYVLDKGCLLLITCCQFPVSCYFWQVSSHAYRAQWPSCPMAGVGPGSGGLGESLIKYTPAAAFLTACRIARTGPFWHCVQPIVPPTFLVKGLDNLPYFVTSTA